MDNVIAALEGGYIPTMLGKCVIEVVQAMLLWSSSSTTTTTAKRMITLEPLPLTEIEPIAAKNIQETISAHIPYWKCLRNNNAHACTQQQ